MLSGERRLCDIADQYYLVRYILLSHNTIRTGSTKGAHSDLLEIRKCIFSFVLFEQKCKKICDESAFPTDFLAGRQLHLYTIFNGNCQDGCWTPLPRTYIGGQYWIIVYE